MLLPHAKNKVSKSFLLLRNIMLHEITRRVAKKWISVFGAKVGEKSGVVEIYWIISSVHTKLHLNLALIYGVTHLVVFAG